MANEKRLIDVGLILQQLHEEGGCDAEKNSWSAGWDEAINRAYHIVECAPTVDAVVLPCKIGDDVYIIPSKVNFDLNVLANHKENNRVYHQKVANIVFAEDGWYMTGSADMKYGTGRILLDRFYKETWFLTKKEAEAALAKMDGGNDNA